VLRLRVHPDVGPADGDRVAAAFLDAIGAGSSAERIMGTVWRDGRVLLVERRAPRAGLSGKILHLHVARRGAPVAG
jgi:hypothetical protein